VSTYKGIGSSGFHVDTASADWTGLAKIQFLSSAMQEAAWRHAETIGFDTQQMERDGVLWVLSRQQMRFAGLPKWKDQIEVRTWYADRERLLFHRDFEISDAKGELLVSVASAWVAVDIKRRRPMRTEKLHHSDPLDLPRAVADAWDPIPALEQFEPGEPFVVQSRDLDMSGHANNINYPEWLLEPLGLEFRAAHDLVSFDIAFQAEAVHGDELQPRLHRTSDGCVLHQLVREMDGKVISSGRTCWKAADAPRSIGWTL